MKALAVIAAALIAVTGVASAPASAQPTTVRVVERTHVEHRSNRGWDNDRRYNNGRHRGWRNNNWKWRTKCHNQWRNGHRERVCRRIRYR